MEVVVSRERATERTRQFARKSINAGGRNGGRTRNGTEHAYVGFCGRGLLGVAVLGSE